MANTRPPSSRWIGWTWIGLGLFLWPAFTRGQPSVSRDVTAAGGGTASASPYVLIDTIGQSAAGLSTSSTYAVNEGFWATFGSPPVPDALVLTALPVQSVQFPVATLLTGSDADGDGLSLVSMDTSSVNGGLVQVVSNIVTYTPAPGFVGADTFNYTIVDTGGDSAVGTVTINILPPILTVTTNADSGPGTLRQALASIGAATTNYDWLIIFAPSLAGQTIALSNGAGSLLGPSALLISNTVVIDGTAAPGLSIGLDPLSTPMRLFFVASGAHLGLQNLTLQNGVAQGGAGAAGAGGGGGGAGLGGGIYNQGTTSLYQVSLSANQALGGSGGGWSSGAPGAGGFPNGGGGGFGPAGYGGGAGGASACGGSGGVGAGAAIFNDGGFLDLKNCVFLNNLARGGGGGAGQSGCNGTNQNGLGGGVFNYNGTAYIAGCLFTNNTADVGQGIVNLGDGQPSWVYLTQDTLTNAGSTNDFLSLNANGGEAQTVESANTIDSQYALWISPIPNVGTIQTNHSLSVPVVLHPPGNLGGVFPLQAASASANIVPAAGLVFAGGGTNFTLTITPAAAHVGTSLITVSAAGVGFSAAASFSATFGLFGSLSVSNLNRVITVTADPGLHIFVQYTAGLVSQNWITLGQAVEIQPGLYQFIDIAPADPARYYRVISQ
jgi:hypothetical protein